MKKTISTISKASAYALVLITLFATSCSKVDSVNESVLADGQARVKINLTGVQKRTETSSDDKAKAGKASAKQVTTGIQTASAALAENLVAIATLEPVSDKSLANTGIRTKASSLRAAATDVKEVLAEGVKYRVLVYDANGNYVTEKDFTAGQSSSADLTLKTGATYTFVAYSTNSTTALPSVTDKQTLASASVNEVSEELMYFAAPMEVTADGDNVLDILLAHQFSQITTALIVGSDLVGQVTGIGNATILPGYASANINLQNGALSYNGGANVAKTVVFPTLGDGVKTAVSEPTTLIHSAVTDGTIRFESLSIAGVTKNDVVFENLRITPGERYNLKITFKGPCTEEVYAEGGDQFEIVDGETKTFDMPAADYGFTFDITEIDNSFQLNINGTDLATQELQFQSGVQGLARNIRFASDRAVWGSNGVPQVYNMKGVEGKPVIRVVIGPKGEVEMWGSRSSQGELEPLELFNGVTFNKIQWNPNNTNTVIASQSVVTITYLRGFGYGRKIITCPGN